MATAQQGIMALPEMSQQAPTAAISPEQMAAFDQIRQSVSPKEFSDEALAGAAEVDPQVVAEFKRALDELDVPPEILDLLNALVDEVLANPENYEAIKEKYRAQGVTDDVLPEEFDPEFFAALNVAVDQLRGEPAGPQSFAKGGIAELKPIAKALASYGRNGDTMLAHITPAEARMLKKRGGSGTVNPVTGLPEFFLKKMFSKIGNAVKKFTRSTVGRLVTTVALGFLVGPAAASMLGVSSVAGVAAVSGFVGSAGSTLLGGGSVRDALKAGAIGGITAGVGAGVMGGADAFASGSYTGPTTISGQFDRAVRAFTPGAEAATPTPASSAPLSGRMDPGAVGRAGGFDVPSAPTTSPLLGRPDMEAVRQSLGNVSLPPAPAPIATGAAPVSSAPLTVPPPVTAPVSAPLDTAARQVGAQSFGLQPSAPSADYIRQGFGQTGTPSFLDQSKDFLKRTFSPSEIAAQGEPAAREAAAKAVAAADKAIPTSITGDARSAMLRSAYDKAYAAASPGMFAKYGPMAAAGLGIMGLTGGFQTREVTSPYADLFTGGPGSAKDLMTKNPYQYYIQNLPGVNYFSGSVLPPPPPPAPAPPGYRDGGAVQYFENGGQATAEEIGRYAATQTPALSTGAPSAAPPVTAPPASSIGTAPGPLQVATPSVGGYNMYSPAAQMMYYGALNQDILSGRQPVGGMPGIPNPRLPENMPGPVFIPDAPLPEGMVGTMGGRGYDPATGRVDLGTAGGSGRFVPAPAFGGISSLPLPSNERLAEVENAYRTLLGRDPDVSGLRFYAGPQFTMDQVRTSIMGSPERKAYETRLQEEEARRLEETRRRIPVTPTDPRTILSVPPSGAADGLPISGIGPEPIMRDIRGNTRLMNTGGIASLGSGGYPRRTGQIDGPGTATSDSIPAMLSDGEFVMTAKAVRGAGNGDRRKGAKKMYALMHRLERNASRG